MKSSCFVKLAGDREAVSVVTGYIMTTAIAVILLVIILTSNSSLIAGTAGQAVRDSLDTLGSDLALRLSNLDRLANASSSLAGNLTDFSFTLYIPLTLAGETYTINITTESILLTPVSMTEFAVYIPLNLTQPLTNRTLTSSAGQLQVFYDPIANALDFRT